MYKFAPASEQEKIVFGASRPGYSNQGTYHWIDFMKQQDIQKVCCLLADEQLNSYSHLLDTYQKEFGNQQICWAAIPDFQLADINTLTQKILPFLMTADKLNEKVVVHCSGGIGRTGHVLAAWLVYGRGFSSQDALAAVKRTGRNPHEAAIASLFKGKNPLKLIEELDLLLNHCRILI
ncbi:dual specificity protein phosphatase family protein [Nostoc sp. NIES-2111]